MEPDLSSIKEKTASGVFWVTISSASVQIINFLTRIILARILLPSDYGIFALGTLVITTLSLVRDMGLSTALVQRKENFKESIDTAFVMSLVMAVFLFLLCAILSPFLSSFFNEKELLPVLRVLSITLLFNPFTLIPFSLMNREMEFKKLFVPEFLSAVTLIVSGIILAKTGHGLWSLVWASVLSAAINLAACNIIYPWKPSFKFSKNNAFSLIKYGTSITGVVIIAFIFMQGDNAVVGKILGSTFLGYYLMGYTFSNLPATGIAGVFNKITIPLFAKFQDYPEDLKRIFLKIFKVNMFIIALVAAIIFIPAEKLTVVLLGKKWLPMVLPMKILCAAGFSRALTSICSAFLWATGKPQIDLKIMSGTLLFFLFSIYPFTKFLGLPGTAVAVSITFAITGLLELFYVIKISGADGKETVLFILKLFVAFFISLMGTSMLNKLISIPIFYSLIFSIIIIIISSLASIFLMDREPIFFMKNYILKGAGNKKN
ncbi:MAG: lipopolysaccharide biosynthesis protein [Firmicutes bacterium]|nr:lipopolysaccharide biosynthesis protein [Bacillota bacterium]